MGEPIIAEQGRTLLDRLRPFFLAVAVIGSARSEAWPLRVQRGEVSSGGLEAGASVAVGCSQDVGVRLCSAAGLYLREKGRET